MNSFGEILSRLPDALSYELSLLPAPLIDDLEEIRLRCGQRATLLYKNKEKAK